MASVSPHRVWCFLSSSSNLIAQRSLLAPLSRAFSSAASAPPPFQRRARTADFRSDTVTTPTAEMGLRMLDARVGDDVYGEDPTVTELERAGASLLEKEAALYTPTATMANLIAVGVHCARGEEVLCGSESHLFIYEQGGASWLMGAPFHTIPNALDGTMPLALVSAALAMRGGGVDVHYPRPALIALENTHNRCGGVALPAAYMDDACALAEEAGVAVHVDGARLLNASTALGCSPARLVRSTSSVSLCLSKGLGAPMGALFVGSASAVARARRLRKALGGGLRQAGVVAAAGLVGLRTHAPLLDRDHVRARALAAGLRTVEGLSPQGSVDTNIVFVALGDAHLSVDAWRARAAAASAAGAKAVVDVASGVAVPVGAVPLGASTAGAFAALLGAVANVRVGPYGTAKLRFVTHHQVDDEDVAAAVAGARIAAALLSHPAPAEGGTERGARSAASQPQRAAAASGAPAPAPPAPAPPAPLAGLLSHTLSTPTSDPVWSLAVLGDGRVASGHASGRVRVWQRDGAVGAELAGPIPEGVASEDAQPSGSHADGVWTLAALPGGRIASGSRDDTVRIWRAATGVCEATLDEHTRGVSSLALLRDGRLAIAGYDDTVKVWDVQPRAPPRCTAALRGSGSVRSLVALPGGGVASGSVEGVISVWDSSGQLVATLGDAACGSVWSLAALPDGRLVSGHGGTTYGGARSVAYPLRVWDVGRATLDAELHGHCGGVDALAVLRDGRIVSGSWQSARVWGHDALAARGGARVAHCELTLGGHTDWVGSFAVLEGGGLASGCWDGVVRVWK